MLFIRSRFSFWHHHHLGTVICVSQSMREISDLVLSMSGSVAQGIGIASLSSTSFRDGIIDHFDGFSLCISLYVRVCANSYFFCLQCVCVYVFVYDAYLRRGCARNLHFSVLWLWSHRKIIDMIIGWVSCHYPLPPQPSRVHSGGVVVSVEKKWGGEGKEERAGSGFFSTPPLPSFIFAFLFFFVSSPPFLFPPFFTQLASYHLHSLFLPHSFLPPFLPPHSRPSLPPPSHLPPLLPAQL